MTNANSRLPSSWWQWLLVSITVLIVTFAAWSEALPGYFLLDDIWHIPIVYRALNGEPDLIWRQFFGPYVLRDNHIVFYRPLIVVYFLLDYLVWKTNAFGYHLTNLILHAITSILAFAASRATIRLLIPDDTSGRRIDKTILFAIPLLVAVMFAAYTGNGEAVCWLTIRIDSCASGFYLAALTCGIQWWLKHKDNRWLIPTSLFLILGLLSKESCATAPFVLLFILSAKQSGILHSTNHSQGLKVQVREFLQAARSLARRLWPLFAILVVYLIARTAALGSFVAGYTGTLGACLNEGFFERLFSLETLLTFFHPINQYLIPLDSVPNQLLNYIYLAGAILVLVNYAKTSCFQLRLKVALLSLSVAFFIVAIAVQNWYITEGLVGMRLAYTASCFTLLAAVLLVYPISATPKSLVAPGLRAACIVLVLLFVGDSIFLSSKMARAYTDASLESDVIRRQLVETVSALPPEKKLVVFNLPLSRNGIAVVFATDFLSGFLSPPLSGSDFWKRIICLDGDPLNSELFNFSALQELIKAGADYEFYTWNSSEQKLDHVSYPELTDRDDAYLAIEPIGTVGAVRVKSREDLRLLYGNREKGDFYTSFMLRDLNPIGPAETPILELKLAVIPESHRPWWQDAIDALPYYEFRAWQIVDTKDGKAKLHNGPDLILSWSSQTEASLENAVPICVRTVESSEPITYHINLTEYKRWLMAGCVDGLRIDLPNRGYRYQLESARLRGSRTYIPKLSFIGKGEMSILGELEVDKNTPLLFRYDAKSIPDARKVMVEVGEDNVQLGFFAHTYRGTMTSKRAAHRINLDKLSGQFELPWKFLPKAACYEVRICAVGKGGELAGSFSDPVAVTTDRAP